MGSRFEDDKGPIADWELVVMRDTDYDAEIAAAEERGRQEAAARIAALEADLARARERVEAMIKAGDRLESLVGQFRATAVEFGAPERGQVCRDASLAWDSAIRAIKPAP